MFGGVSALERSPLHICTLVANLASACVGFAVLTMVAMKTSIFCWLSSSLLAGRPGFNSR
jgi:hypothetical protein